MSSTRGRRKHTPELLGQKKLIHQYFKASNEKADSKLAVESILNDILDEVCTDSAAIARKIVDDVIVEVCIQRSSLKKPKHSGEKVSEKTLKEWTIKFPWLLIEGEKEQIKLCCSVCKSQKESLKLTNVFAFEGSPSVQKSSLLRHSACQDHISACKSVEQSKEPVTDDAIRGEECRLHVSEQDDKLFRIVYFVSKSELPSETVNGMLQVEIMHGVDIPYRNLSWDTITEIQRSIAFVLKTDIVKSVKESKFFGLLIDESTDITIEKRLSICIRYVHAGKPVTTFLCNIPLDDGKATTIVNCVVNTLQELGITLDSCVSLATDGASVMTGKKTGVGVQLQSKYSPFCIQTHCVAHRLNLACTDTIKKDPFMMKFKEKFGNLYNFISNSSIRTLTLKQLQAILDEPELTIKEPHPIRWLGLKKAVEAVYASYASVIATLSRFASEEKNPIAKGLHKYFNSYKVALVTAFMLDIHTELGVLSCQLQKQNLLFSEISPLVNGTLSALEHLATVDGIALSEMKQRISIENQEATLSGEVIKFSASMESEFETIRSDYVKSMVKNLRNRFKKNDVSILDDLSRIFEPSMVNTKDSLEAIEHISTFYGHRKEVRVVEGDLNEGVVEHQTVVNRLLDPENLQKEWPRLEGMIHSGAYSTLSTQQLCRRIILLHSDLFPNFAILAKIALCMQLTSVDCERSFSTQNRLKSKYRASLGAEKLDILLTISMLGPTVESINLKPAVRHWLKKKRRRKSRLTSEYRPRAKKKKVQ